MPTIAELQKECYAIADDHGFHDKPRDFGLVIALIHSEASEALESYRDSEPVQRQLEEFADICIRVFDACEEFQLGDLEQAILKKMEKNRGRPHMHGKTC